MAKHLIINADDFGLNKEQNEAIKDLLNNKLITSTSLMAVAAEAKDAVGFAEDIGFPVGVHITLNSDEEAYRYPSLTKAKSLGEDYFWLENRNLTFRAKRKDVRAELEAQYRYISDGGAQIDHADSHCGTVYGINGRRFYLDAFDFCNEHSLPFRFPKTPGFIERQIGIKVPSPIVKLQQMIVNSAEKQGVSLLDDLVSNPWAMDRIKDYETLRKYYLDAVDNCLEGVTEIFLHPAFGNEKYGREWHKREFEYQLLKSGDLLQRARDKGIKVVGWEVFG